MFGLYLLRYNQSTPCDVRVSDVFWYHDARQLDDNEEGRCTVTQNDEGLSRLRLRNIKTRDAGTYVTVAVNEDGTCRHVFHVTVTSMYTCQSINQSFIHSFSQSVSQPQGSCPEVD